MERVESATKPKVPVRLGLIVICAGGFMDAYSYLLHDHVFATGQTGNIVLLCMNLAEGAWLGALHYLVSILAFVAGIMLSRHVLVQVHNRATHRMQRWVAVFEAVAFAAIALLPAWAPDLLVNSAISFCAAVSYENFRQFGTKSAYASVFCTCAPLERPSTTGSSRRTVTSCTGHSAMRRLSCPSAWAPLSASFSSTSWGSSPVWR